MRMMVAAAFVQRLTYAVRPSATRIWSRPETTLVVPKGTPGWRKAGGRTACCTPRRRVAVE
ncbi:hypothetical protein [Nonomuraea dietziae]|uniref:hypothetical protein n=1 Tax=Nonomuraea dietziae TaxID=65515 RepID=UPI0031DDDBCA